jgi:ParB/RepB/Spo0J family partition protein
MSAEEPIEGYWMHPQSISKGVYHFFVEGAEESICGKWRLREMSAGREVRKPGNDDCVKCCEIHQEIFAVKPPAAPEPDWTVKTDPIEKTHTLYYQGAPQSTVRGETGHATQKELAVIFNRNGTVPKKQGKARCAADAPNPAKFLEKKAHQSPTLPLEIESPPATPQPNIAMSAKAKALTPPPVDVATGQVQEFPASQFHRAEDNRVITPEQTAKMSDSIRQVGVLQPITARWITNAMDVQVLEIVLGECRWRGCLDIDENYPVPCFVRTLSDKDAARIRAIENFQRKDLDEVEEARAIQNLKDTGWTVDEIMNFLGVKKDHIYLRLTLLKLSEEAHQAIRDGNLTLQTAAKLASLPEEQRTDALKAVVTPTHSAKALPERAALDLLDRDFVEPAKRAKEWEKRRDVILENHPGAKWLPYDEARALTSYKSGYVMEESSPAHELLSDAAREGELLVSTWGSLAAKHGAELVIGCNYNDQASAYVLPQPIIDAEKAACTANPNECIFTHEAAIYQAREDAERRKLEEEQRKAERAAHRAELELEEKRLVALILSPDGLTKTAVKKLIDRCHCDILETSVECADLAKIFDLSRGEEEDYDAHASRVEAAAAKYLKSKALEPFEAIGRLTFAAYVIGYCCSYDEVCETIATKAADFPAMHREYQEMLAAKAACEAEEKADAAAGDFVDGEPNANQEDDAA